MRFKGLDLNLIVAFGALLETRSVSRAAEHLNMSQPAMTAALNRLREYFQDELFVQNGRRMEPSVLASSLQPQIRQMLNNLQILVSTTGEFNAATAERSFRIATSDFIAATVIAPLAPLLARTAPGIRLELLSPSDSSKPMLERGDLDLFVTPEEFMAPQHPAVLMFEEDHVLVGWAENPAFRGEIDEEQFFAMSHVATTIGVPVGGSFAERRLDAMGRTRRIALQTPFFTLVPFMLIGTQHVAVMHRRLAARMALHLPLAIAPLPFSFPVMREMIQYHRLRSNEPGLRWLIDVLRGASNIST